MAYTQVSPNEGIDDNFDIDLNPFELGAAVAAAGIGVASVGITSIAAPTAVLVPGAIAGGLAVAGYNQRHGHLPFMGDKGKEAAAPTPGQVTDTTGTPVPVASL